MLLIFILNFVKKLNSLMTIRNFIQVLVILYFSIGQANAQVPRNCKEILDLNPAALSGVYSIDPDGTGPLPTMDCQCDMVTDGGGWTLILNYNHLTATNPSLNVRTNSLPLMGQASLGFDESGTIFWGHTSNSLFNSLNFSEVRFYAKTSNHNRVINFKTSNQNVLNYFKTGTGSTSGIATNFSPLAGHTSFLPAAIDMTTSNQGDLSLTEYPMWTANAYHWYISPSAPNSNGRWEVDDCWVNFCTSLAIPNPSTHHEVWGRTCTSYSKTIQESENYFDWNGTTYTESGIFEKTLVNSAGCDSIAQLDLTIIDVPCGSFDDTLIQHVGNKMIKVNQVTGESVDWFTISNLGSTEVTRLTWNDAHQCFYTIARLPGGAATATQKWVLIGRIGTDGIYSNLGQISIPSETIFHLESIAYSYLDNNLYVAGSLDNNLSSESLIRINTSTMTGEFVGLFTSTQNDADGMEFDLSGNVYYFDGVPGSSTRLYKQDVAFQNPAELLVSEGYAAYNDITIKGDTVFITINNQIRKLLPSTNAFVTVGNMTPSAIYSGLTFKGLSRTPYKFNFQGDTSATACSSFEWYGNIFTQSGIYFDTLQAKNGCDSLVKLNLTINPCLVPEICNNEIDDDLDGFVDGFDPDCSCLNNEWFNICTPACQSIPETQPFAMQQQWVSTQNVPGYSTPLVGDLNADGIPEVVIQGSENIYTSGGIIMLSKNILVLNGIDGSQISSFETPYADFEVTSPLVIVDIDNNGQGEILLASSANVNAPADQTYLYCYDINGNLLWKSDSKYGVNASNYSGGTLGVADFNNDGTAEVYVFNEIFNAQTGIKLVDGGNNGIGHMYYPYPSLGLFSQTVAVDLTSHPGLELAAGKTVYEVNIANTNGTTGNTMTAINSPNGRDGFTSIADMDLDGELDVIVADQGSSASSLLYVWNPRTISIIASTSMPTNAGGADAFNVGVPVIGDMDGEGTPEIGVVRPGLLLTYKFNGSTTLSQFWSLATDDQSGVTKLSIFDFNQDGRQEIVYRDQSQLRILDGATSNTLTATPLISCTAVEGPVVADIDGDGEAEILIVGDVGFCSNYGLLYAFGSGSAAWAPARKVWNQYAYFNVNINDNLTVPQQQQNHGLQFYQSLGNCSGASLRPLNSFMMQETVRDVTGCPIFPANVTNIDTAATACQSFDWYGTNYTTSGDYTQTLLAQSGCDSIVTLHLTINLPSTGDTTATACQSFNWHGNSYSNSGDYQHILTNSVGCDSTVTLHLTIYPTSTSDTTATSCSSFTWYGTTYSQAGDYTKTLQSMNGCDSTVTLHLTITTCPNTASGIINKYTPVTAFNVCENSISVANASEFNVGDRVLLIQMKGAVINTDNAPTFGDITNYGDAGNYEFANILSIVGNEITFVNQLLRSYTVSGLVQLVYVPVYTGDVLVENTLTCEAWNGSTGGVLVFESDGTVYVNNDIDVSDKGFRSGPVNPNGGIVCGQLDFFYPISSVLGGRKGEGIHELPNSMVSGRGKNANGGGGGNNTNSGGAGGGNYGLGGIGGNQWYDAGACQIIPNGGRGGSSLTYSNLNNKVFLGGGAGGGHQNDATATPGTNGGGIVILNCSAISAIGGGIKAFANNSVPSPNDGAGGGGAGGSVLLKANNILGNLSIDVHGGRGGNSTTLGPGGGGGGGLVWTSNPMTSNVILNTSGGDAGLSTHYGDSYGAGAGNIGGRLNGLVLPESIIPFNQTTLTGDTTATSCSSFTWYGTTYSQAGDYTKTLQSMNGCDSTVTLHLTINSSISTIDTQNACESFTWIDGNTYTQSTNTPNVTLQSISGCDSIVTLNLTINQELSSDTNATACLSFTWYGTTYNQSGDYTHTLQSVNGCDSVVTLHLSINSSISTIDTQSACESFTWIDGNTYTQSTNTPTVTLQSVLGCDSIVTLNLTFFNAITGDTNVVTCENFTWNGTTYSSSGTYSQNLQTVHGCDSLVNLNLTINQTSVGDTTASVCSSFSWYGNSYSNSGDFQHILTNSVGCDSTVTLHLTIFPTSSSDISATACESFTWYGTTYNQSGDYTHTLQSVNGCDSIVTLHLTISNSISTIDTQSACENFTWIDGNTYTQSTNTPSVTLQSVLGCDSIVTLNLTIYNAITRDTNVVACENFTWNGTNYSSSGTYSQSFQTVHGCDSLVNLNLTINQTSVGDTTASVCSSFSWYGNSYSNSGDFQHVLSNSVGCDSIVTLHLTIFPTSSSDTSATACESFTWYGTTYNQSGTYSHLLQTINGCDSTVNLNLSILNSNASIDTQSACESFTWIDGNTYNQSTNTPSVTLQSVLGCDSIVTLNLSIFNAITRDTNVVACENFTWNGTNYSNSGTYSQSFQTINGCDSLVNLNLTINQTSIGDTTASVCTSFSWYGNSYSNSGDFQHILTNSVGCDSTVTLHLTIFPTSSSDTSATACESFTWYGTTYNQSGIYSHLLQTVNGCDSTVNLNLTINQVVIHEDIIVSWTGSYTWIDGITYTNSNNTASFTFPNAAANGCDSIVTLDLFVGVRGYDTIIACDNYTWIDGITYSQSTNTPEFTFPNGSSLGADSVSILVLTINQSSSSIEVQSACLSYTWMDGNTYTSSTNTPTFTLQNAVGCDSIITLNLTIFNPTIGDTSASACETFTWYGNTYAASGDYSQLLQSQNGCDSTVILHLTIHQATFGDTTAISCGAFTWYGNNYPNSGTYTHLLQNMHGCDSLVSLNLTVNEFQSFDVNVVSCGTHTWNGINYESSGTYTQSFPIGEACDSIVNLNLTVIPKPLAQFSTDKLETDIVNPSILFENQSENAISYLWNLGDGVSSNEADLEHSYSEPNNYTIRLIAYATEDCTDTAFVTIKVTNVPIYYVPNSFTPNGDELNNTFKPIFGPNFTPKEYEFRIYNRWGEVLFVSFDPSIGWDGTYLELGLVQNGVYTYQINFLSNEQEVIKLTGTVNVIR
jgi:gliding motility-associated-like protein